MTESPLTGAPVRRAEARAVAENPEGTAAPLAALRTVLLYSIAAPFSLLPEEVFWVNFHLEKVLAPLVGKQPEVVPLAVRQEMLEGTYSQALDAIEEQAVPVGIVDPQAATAEINDWVAVLMGTITQCYTLRPIEESAMHGRLIGLLRELGVSDPQNPRGAVFLPNDVRHRLANNK